jgi:hypothetical protein
MSTAEEPKIPTHEEFWRGVRRIWIVCILVATAIFGSGGSLIGYLLFVKGSHGEHIIYVSTSIFQVLVMSYGMGFFVPAFLTSLRMLGLGLRMNRRALEIGEKTASNLDMFKRDLTPVLDDLKSAVGNAKAVLEEFRTKDLDKIQKVLGDLAENNKLERFVNAVEKLASRVDGPPPDGGTKEELVRRISGGE